MRKSSIPFFVRLLAPTISAVGAATGCVLSEVRGKSRFGPEFRHSGGDSTNAVRWTVQQGIDLKWDNDVTTGLLYRRRDVDEGSGSNDNGIWVDVAFPLWKAPSLTRGSRVTLPQLQAQVAELAAQVADLRRRLARFVKEPTRSNIEGSSAIR